MSHSTSPIKVAITGAAGQIGYALVFRIASGQMFGPHVPVELQLIELEAALPALDGVVMELEDCAFPLLKRVTTTADLSVGMKDVNWALLVGAVPRKAGMERADLLKINGPVFVGQGQAINNNAASDVRVLVVGNPCNTNCYIAMNAAPDVPNDRFFAMTQLDENRARAQLANRAGVSVSAIQHMAIWGNHSSTQYPDFHHATINGKPVTDVINDKAWLEGEFLTTVQSRGAAVIKARGASSAASAANAAIQTVYNITHDTSDYYSVCLCSQGQYGVDPGLIYSFPCQTQAGQLNVIEGLQHGPFSQEKLKATLEELRNEKAAVAELLV